MSAEIAVFICRFPISSVTFAVVFANARTVSGSGLASVKEGESIQSPDSVSSQMRRQTRARKRTAPSIPFELHGFICSSGPINISNTRKASAPCSAMTSSGFTTLPTDFDILRLSSPRIIPWLTNLRNGSGWETIFRSKSTLCQKRAYKR